MKIKYRLKKLVLIFCFIPLFVQAQNIKVLTNHIGYESSGSKRAVILAESKLSIPVFELVNTSNGKVVFTGKPEFSGTVAKWKTGCSGRLILVILKQQEIIKLR